MLRSGLATEALVDQSSKGPEIVAQRGPAEKRRRAEQFIIARHLACQWAGPLLSLNKPERNSGEIEGAGRPGLPV